MINKKSISLRLVGVDKVEFSYRKIGFLMAWKKENPVTSIPFIHTTFTLSLSSSFLFLCKRISTRKGKRESKVCKRIKKTLTQLSAPL